jgi:signal transduction histidine kinase
MVSVAITLGLAKTQIDRDPAEAGRLIAEAHEEAQLAVKELRELARGIHPALLSDRGLGPALEALAARAPIPVEVSGAPEAPLEPAIEAATYYVTAEALTNVAKYAEASCASVTLRVENGHLRLEVSDDGIGGASLAHGTGLRGLRDRVDALDGELEVDSPRGCGTTITVVLPV